MPRRCPRCSYVNKDLADVCGLCSEVLPLRSQNDEMLEEPRQLKGGRAKARHQRLSDTRVHCLVPTTGEPVPMQPQVRFVMGRDPRASLSIQAEDISRQHAEVLWTGDPPEPRVRDIRSRNGTYVNRERLARDEERELRHGDMIQLSSSFTCTYRHMAPPDLDKELLREKRADMTLDMLLPAGLAMEGGGGSPQHTDPGGGSLEGAFECLSARRLLLMLEVIQASGRLVIECGASQGELGLEGGRPVHVEYAGIEGVDAMRAIGALERGRFVFYPGGRR